MQQQQQQQINHLIGKNIRRYTGYDNKLNEETTKSKSKTKRQCFYVDEYLLFGLGATSFRALHTPNAGGNSLVSEALSVQYFADLGATDFIFEKEIVYNFYNCKMVDFVMTLKKKRIGVSVSRAMSHNTPFDEKQAEILLKKKLYGLVIARNCVSKKHSFFTSILHVQCQNSEIARILQKVYHGMNDETSDEWISDLRGTLFLILTTVHSSSPFYVDVFNLRNKKKKKLKIKE